MFDFKILFAIIFIIISDENLNQVFSQIHVRVAYLFLSDNNNSPITILPTNQFELYNICRGFKSKKSSGYDNIPMHIIKKSFDIICQPLVNLINLSLATGIFPDKLEIAKVIPIYKMGDTDRFAKYS
jgi:hypothetical protein